MYHSDGLHFNPNGHRIISCYLAKFMINLYQETSQELINLSSLNDNRIVDLHDTSNETK